MLFWIASAVPAQGAAPPLLRTFGTNCGDSSKIFLGECGFEAGETVLPRGIAADPDTGNYYVANQGNRIDEYSPWGVFLRAWGWGVLDGTAELQTCTADTGCLKGLEGTGAGQLDGAQGVAIDSAGDVYVVDWFDNNRVQKFDPSGATVKFELMFGGEVNKTTLADVCTQADVEGGDVCGAATTGNPGPGEGQFGNWVLGSFIAIDAGPPADVVYVGDQERIQKFDTNGNFIGQISIPGETVQSLAVDSASGNLYAAYHFDVFASKGDVQKLTPTGGSVCTLKVPNPRAIAVDASGDVYVVNRQGPVSGVLEFDNACQQIDLGVAEPGFGSAELTTPTGIATSSPPTCGLEGTDILVANGEQTNSFLNLYGAPPDPDVCPPPSIPPTISAQFAVSANATSATVRAEINPHFWPDTRYFVQYGTGKCSEGGCTAQQPLGEGSLLTNKTMSAEVITKAVFLTDLQSDTTYHYRFVAQSSGGGPVYGIDPDDEGPEEASFASGLEATFHTFPPRSPAKVDCQNQQFRTGFSAPLPSCRAYEMVSPVDKNNGDVFQGIEGAYPVASTDGTRASFTSYRGFANPEAAPFRVQFLATRNAATGWSTNSISPPRSTLSFYETGGPAQAPQYKAFSPDLCKGWVLQDANVPLVPGAPDGYPGLYQRSFCGEDGYQLITQGPPPGFPPFAIFNSVYFPEIQGFSENATRTVFRADAQLTPDACTTPAKEIFQVYEETGGGELRLISVKPNGQATCTHSSVGTAQGLPGAFKEDSVKGAVSADAERVYWTDYGKGLPFGNGSGDQPGTLYLRINAAEEQSATVGDECTEAEKACTLKVSGLVSSNPARFQIGSKDGSIALFSIGETLYRFELEPTPHVTEVAKGFKGLMGTSEDASRVYLASSEAFDTGAAAGQTNLYFLEGSDFRFIGTFSSTDVRNESSSSAPPSPIATLPLKRRSRITLDGLHAAFMSVRPLTGYDNTDVSSGRPDAEVFLYDATANGGEGELVCASCNPSGVRPAGRQLASGDNNKFQYWAAAQIPGWASQLQGSRSLSDDGQRLFFESYEALVPRDTNGKQDVYLWQRASDKEDCEKGIGGELFLPENSGCLSLISSGESPDDSEFMDASADGSSAFILTNASLLPQDPGLIDVYVARVGGGFPPPPPPPPPCEGESCQSPQAPPAAPAPASATFRGVGNVKQGAPKPRCPKGKRKVRRSGKTRCVPRRTKNNRKARSKR